MRRRMACSRRKPAAWKGNLALILPRRQKLSKVHLAALPYRDVAAFIRKLREHKSVHALALEFTILTAARLGEVLGATWSEIDLAAKVWTLPPSRMKAGREHRVPLSARAIEIVKRMAGIRTNEFLFPGQRRERPLSQGALRKLCPSGATIHGSARVSATGRATKRTRRARYANRPSPISDWDSASTADMEKAVSMFWQTPKAGVAIDCSKSGFVVIDPDRHPGAAGWSCGV